MVSSLAKLAQLLGIGEHQAEDALHSESVARVALSRRNLLAAGAALATGAAFSFGAGEPAGFWVQNGGRLRLRLAEVRINGHRLPGLVSFTYSLDSGRTFSPARALPADGKVVLPNGATLSFPPLLQPQQVRLRRLK